MAWWHVDHDIQHPVWKRLAQFTERIDVHDDQKADLFNKWEEQLVFWHENGHLLSQDHINYLRQEFEKRWEKFHLNAKANLMIFDYEDRFQRIAEEMYAELEVLRQLEKINDANLQEFQPIRHLSSICNQIDTLSQEDEGQRHVYHITYLFCAQAMLTEKPAAFLQELLNKMEEKRMFMAEKGIGRIPVDPDESFGKSVEAQGSVEYFSWLQNKKDTAVASTRAAGLV